MIVAMADHRKDETNAVAVSSATGRPLSKVLLKDPMKMMYESELTRLINALGSGDLSREDARSAAAWLRMLLARIEKLEKNQRVPSKRG
jgi:hypothetical protein